MKKILYNNTFTKFHKNYKKIKSYPQVNRFFCGYVDNFYKKFLHEIFIHKIFPYIIVRVSCTLFISKDY